MKKRTDRGKPTAGAGPTPFEVDEQRLKISCFGTPLELSRYELGILRVLAAGDGEGGRRALLLGGDRLPAGPPSGAYRRTLSVVWLPESTSAVK